MNSKLYDVISDYLEDNSKGDLLDEIDNQGLTKNNQDLTKNT